MENRQDPSRTRHYGRGPSRETSVPVLTFSSGKGGVGKSCITANLGTLLARSGLRVLLVDGDFGLANLDMLLGVSSGVTLEEVLDGKARIQDAIIGIEPNLWLLPASAGLLEARDYDSDLRERMIRLFDEFPWEMDLVLVDVGAGIQSNVLSLHSPAFRTCVVLSPDPTSLTDAYGLIKLLRKHCGITQVSVVVNQVTDGKEARLVFQRLRDVAARFIDVQIDYLGHWERDEKIVRAVMKRKTLLDWDQEARSLPSLELLAKQVRSRFIAEAVKAQAEAGAGFVRVDQGEDSYSPGFWRMLLSSASSSAAMAATMAAFPGAVPGAAQEGQQMEVRGKA